jgi:protein gp37
MASQRDGGVSWTNPTGYTGESWNVVRGCADRCGARCWAERQAIRQVRGNYAGLVERTPNGPRWTGLQRFVTEKLSEPLHWREPRCVAVSLMGDLFGSGITDDQLDCLFGIMWACRWMGADTHTGHVFIPITKQAARMRDYMSQDRRAQHAQAAVTYGGGIDPDGLYDSIRFAKAPHPRIVPVVSCLDQATLDALLPDLLATPAACRGVSLEPLLEPVNAHLGRDSLDMFSAAPPLDWVIVGAESGTGPLRTKGARYCDQGWVLDVVRQCSDAGVACHVKQIHLGAPPDYMLSHDPLEWREPLRVRQWPEVFK